MVDAKRFSLHHFAEVSLKGGTVATRQHWLGPLVSIETEPLHGTGMRWNAGLTYRFAHEQWVLFGMMHYGYTAFRAVQLTTFEHDVGLRLAAGYRFVTQHLMPVVALTVDGTVRHQAYVRDLESDIQALGFGALAPRTSLGLTGGILLGLEIPLPAWLQAFPWLTGQVRFPVARGEAWGVAGAVGLAMGIRF